MKAKNFKRIILVMILSLITISASAEVINFRTQAYSYREYTRSGWSDWSRWIDSDMLITMNLNTDVITVYSPRTQVYQILDYSDVYWESGAKCIDYHFYDQDGDRGTMSLVIKPGGQSEIYIRFANVQWAYIVIRY